MKLPAVEEVMGMEACPCGNHGVVSASVQLLQSTPELVEYRMLVNWNETLKKILVVCLVAQDMAFPGMRWTAGRPPPGSAGNAAVGGWCGGGEGADTAGGRSGRPLPLVLGLPTKSLLDFPFLGSLPGRTALACIYYLFIMYLLMYLFMFSFCLCLGQSTVSASPFGVMLRIVISRLCRCI